MQTLHTQLFDWRLLHQPDTDKHPQVTRRCRVHLTLWMKIVSRFLRDIRLNQLVTHIPISFHTKGINLLCELKVVWRLETRITDSTIQLRLPSVESVQACALPDMLKPLDHSTAVPHYEHGDERQTPAKHINPCKTTWWSTEKPP